MDWSDGYVSDIEYTYGYYPELNPVRVDFALANYGLASAKIKNACELGFGQGVSLCVNSVHPQIKWYGTDFNPTQALFAKELSSYTHNNPFIVDEDFKTFCARSDLPQFEFIALHGIWSWISSANRKVIVDFLKNKLAVGGVLYVSYNTQPGWSAMIPVRDMLTIHSNTMAAQGLGLVRRIDAALDFADNLMKCNPKFKEANPQVQERLERIKKQDRHYLAHEYFNADWAPMGFAAMNALLIDAKLSYAGSANFADGVPSINFNSEQIDLIRSIEDPVFSEVIKDICVNQGFRKDYWVKGTRKLTAYERSLKISNIPIALITEVHDIELKVMGNLGEAQLTKTIYEPLLLELRKHEKITIGELTMKAEKFADKAQVLEAVLVLLSKNNIAIAMTDNEVKDAQRSTSALNSHLATEAISKDEVPFLVSPVTLTGLPLSKFERLFLLALKNNCKTPDEIGIYVWNLLAAQGQRVVKDGSTLESSEENLSYITSDAQNFLEKSLGLLKMLKVHPL